MSQNLLQALSISRRRDPLPTFSSAFPRTTIYRIRSGTKASPNDQLATLRTGSPMLYSDCLPLSMLDVPQRYDYLDEDFHLNRSAALRDDNALPCLAGEALLPYSSA